MMTGLVVRAWQTVKPHIPMIRFSKGGPSTRGHAPSQPAPSAPKGSASVASSSGPVIEDWQLPPRYRRASLDAQEIDAINSGGAY